MTKYYVRSGELERIIVADCPFEAAEQALEKAEGECIDRYFFYVDERGFRGPTENYPAIDTRNMPDFAIKINDIIEVQGED